MFSPSPPQRLSPSVDDPSGSALGPVSTLPITDVDTAFSLLLEVEESASRIVSGRKERMPWDGLGARKASSSGLGMSIAVERLNGVSDAECGLGVCAEGCHGTSLTIVDGKGIRQGYRIRYPCFRSPW